jgi:glycosyltransferase involved in cell wall biosynthesis
LSIEIIIVDDFSTDNSLQVASELSKTYDNIKIFNHEKNQGKGAALRTGFKYATGHYVVVQDADLEYDPMDFKKLILPLKENIADVVLGSRYLSSNNRKVPSFWHTLGNRFLTFMSNIFTDLYLTDMETCYKMFRRDIIQEIEICEDRFGFEPEIIAKIARKKLRVFEISISYERRTYAQGKKIGVRDGIRAVYCIIKYTLFSR